MVVLLVVVLCSGFRSPLSPWLCLITVFMIIYFQLWCFTGEVEDPYVDRTYVCLFVLRFYGPVNPMGSCRARSVYLTTRLLGRLSPLSG